MIQTTSSSLTLQTTQAALVSKTAPTETGTLNDDEQSTIIPLSSAIVVTTIVIVILIFLLCRYRGKLESCCKFQTTVKFDASFRDNTQTNKGKDDVIVDNILYSSYNGVDQYGSKKEKQIVYNELYVTRDDNHNKCQQDRENIYNVISETKERQQVVNELYSTYR